MKPVATERTDMFKFLKDENAATAIEYGLIAALVAIALIASLGLIGDELTALFTNVSTELNDVNNP